jgi:hypothetical protein
MMEIENNWKREVKEVPTLKVTSTDEEEITPTVDDFENNLEEDDLTKPFEEEIDDDFISEHSDDTDTDIEE